MYMAQFELHKARLSTPRHMKDLDSSVSVTGRPGFVSRMGKDIIPSPRRPERLWGQPLSMGTKGSSSGD
jgi:hypothetical protein